jgi:hypothetical protein
LRVRQGAHRRIELQRLQLAEIDGKGFVGHGPNSVIP